MSVTLQLYRAKEKWKRRFHKTMDSGCTVLLYHRIIDLNYDPQLLCVSPENFYEQLSQLKNKFHFITLQEFKDTLASNKKFNRNSLLITFDDGYADNYYNALPVLETLDLQAVFYIATANLDTENLFWWDELDLRFKNKNHAQKYQYYLNELKSANSFQQRNTLLEDLRKSISLEGYNKVDYKFLSTEELKRLCQSKSAIIGAHTVNHLSLGHLSDAEQKYEVETSVNILKNKLNQRIVDFSFPYGEKHNYSDTTIQICKESNLQSSAANYLGYVKQGTDLFSFPRFVVRNDKAKELIKKIKFNR